MRNGKSQTEQPHAGSQPEINRPEIIEVHNAWAIHGLNPDGSLAKQPIAQFARPQDWGDPRWVYHRFRFWWLTPGDGKRYVSNAHCWTDLKLDEPGRYPELFAHLVCQIMIPGVPAELCGRDYLANDDFWRESWGEMPPFYDYGGDGASSIPNTLDGLVPDGDFESDAFYREALDRWGSGEEMVRIKLHLVLDELLVDFKDKTGSLPDSVIELAQWGGSHGD